MSRVLVVVFVCCIVSWVGAGLAHAADPSATVPFDHGWGDPMQSLCDAGVIIGHPDGSWRGDEVMTRYEFAAGWARFVEKLGLPKTTKPAEMTMDVPAGHWALPSVERLVVAGLLPVSEFGDVDPMHWAAGGVAALDGSGTRRLVYRGDAPLLRREYAQVAYRTRLAALASKREATSEKVGYDQATRYLREFGVFIGYPDGHMYMTQPMTRMEFTWATGRCLEQLTSALARAK